MADRGIDRRRLLVGSALIGATGAVATRDGALNHPGQTIHGTLPWTPGAADAPPEVSGRDYVYFNAAEAAFVEAACARLIPNDELGPGAVEAGVPFFIDRQLAGPFGHGDRFYLAGPWAEGTPTQGYQSRFSPAQLYRASIPAIDRYCAGHFNGAAFKSLQGGDQDQVLKALESGQAQLEGADAKTFFKMFWQNVLEGYFADPIYGGNRNLAVWRMLGFPGAHYDYREWVGRHGQPVPFKPVGIKGRPGWTEA